MNEVWLTDLTKRLLPTVSCSERALMYMKKKPRTNGACKLESHTSDAGFGQSSIKKKRLADSEVILEDTKVQLEADEELFMETKSACRKKAGN